MSPEECCRYVRSSLAESNVHLVATRLIRGGKAKREPGEFICSKAYGRTVKFVKDSTRDEFLLEPCFGCVKTAEALGITLGDLWSDIPGVKVHYYTTSPPERDLPYVTESKSVGEYYNNEVRRILVPEHAAQYAERWYKRDQYHFWNEPTWNIMVETDRAELF